MNRQIDNIDVYYNSLEYFQNLEKSLAYNLGLSDLTSGLKVIRDKRGWRENEKLIEYIWIVQVSCSFVGDGGLFSVKFNENIFREHSNKEEIVQGIFICNQSGIEQVYTKTLTSISSDIIKQFRFNLFEANNGITIDGVSYSVRIIAPNIDTFITLNNPNTEDWKHWEQEVLTLGKELAKESNNQKLIKLFGLGK